MCNSSHQHLWTEVLCGSHRTKMGLLNALYFQEQGNVFNYICWFSQRKEAHFQAWHDSFGFGTTASAPRDCEDCEDFQQSPVLVSCQGFLWQQGHLPFSVSKPNKKCSGSGNMQLTSTKVARKSQNHSFDTRWPCHAKQKQLLYCV